MTGRMIIGGHAPRSVEAGDAPQKRFILEDDDALFEDDDRLRLPGPELAVHRLARHTEEIAELALREAQAEPPARGRRRPPHLGERQQLLRRPRRLVEKERVLHV